MQSQVTSRKKTLSLLPPPSPSQHLSPASQLSNISNNCDRTRFLELLPFTKINLLQFPSRRVSRHPLTIMANYISNLSSNHQLHRSFDQDSQTSILASCYTVEPSTSKVHGFHYCTTLGAGKHHTHAPTSPLAGVLMP